MNLIYTPAPEKKLINRKDLKKYAWDHNIWPDKNYDLSRIDGNHCSCEGNGKFILLPDTHEAVIEGGKAYMECEVCGEFSHL